MTTDTHFLPPIGAAPDIDPLFVESFGDVIFSNFNVPALDVSTDAVTDSVVIGGTAITDADADALATQDPASSDLITEAIGEGEAGSFQGSASGEATVVSTFEVAAHQEFAFEFSIIAGLSSKEIDDPIREFASAQSNTAFAILDVSNPDNPVLLDEFTLDGLLTSSNGIASLTPAATSANINLSSQVETSDVGSDNDIDFIEAEIDGTYSRTFDRALTIAVIKINTSSIELAGDYLLGNLGDDVRYGTLGDDRLWGTLDDDKIYGSHGDDALYGRKGNDILEGGHGNDTLVGHRGEDKLFGSYGNDRLLGRSDNDIVVGGTGNDLLDGGQGNDKLTGGAGADTFQFSTGREYRPAWLGTDHITDYEEGTDSIALSLKTFTQLTGTAGSTLASGDFAAVATNTEAATSDALVVYNTNTGHLFYNQNGSASGLGRGSHFASLETITDAASSSSAGIPGLSASDFNLVA